MAHILFFHDSSSTWLVSGGFRLVRGRNLPVSGLESPKEGAEVPNDWSRLLEWHGWIRD